jgi:hypothetical protein
MNEYELKDQEGRDIFKLFCSQQKWCKHIKDSTNKYAKWDLAYTSGNTQMVGEIKYRKEYDGSAFPDWILEVDKLKALQVIHAKMTANGHSTRITYINHFNNNYTLIWDLTDLNISKCKVKQVLLKKNDFDDEQMLKDVIYLPQYQSIFKGETDEDELPF